MVPNASSNISMPSQVMAGDLSKPSTSPKSRFPCVLQALVSFFSFERRDIGEVHVAFSRATIPSKHRVDSLRELGIARFLDATTVHPEVSQAVPCSLFCAELDLTITDFILARALYQIFIGDLFTIISRCV